ncbi:MAG: TonB-dependent receptor [Bacteroidia bacterium]|nr:TonB-dependent receptor [Bacteroidia bacterium]
MRYLLVFIGCLQLCGICFAQNREKVTKANDFYTITGKITDKSTGKPLSTVSIYITGINKGAVSDANGLYQISPVSRGSYEIRYSFIGYKEVTRYIQLSAPATLNVSMEESFIELESVTVSPGIINIAATTPTVSTLSSKEIFLSPNFAKDINRTLRVIPGFANNDISAKPRIRGGHWNETATYIDNFEIYEPYHFEEADGLASIFNTDYAREIKISTGGYPAKFTDKMSGIIEVKTPDYVSKNQVSASIDFLNATLYGKMRINDKTNLLYGFRRGYLDLLMNTSDAETKISPIYYDIWCKVNYQLNQTNLLSLNFLNAKNDFHLKTINDHSQNTYFHNIKNNNFGWLNWKWLPNSNYYALTTMGYQDLYASSVNHFIQSITPENIDKRFGQIFILTQNHLWNIGSKHSMEFGLELKEFKTYYGFNETRYDLYNSTPNNIRIDTINVDSQINGFTFASFIQDTWTITKKIVILPGIRISKQSYSNGWNISPRLAAKAEIIKNLNLKIAYGIYYQPDNFEKLKSFEGQQTPLAISSKCIHYTSSLDYSLVNTNFKVDVYFKDYPRLSDDFRYDVYYRLINIDKGFDTKSGKSKGIEFTMRHKYGKDNILTVSYAWAKNTIRNSLNQETNRDFDRRNSITINSIQNLPRNWSFSFLWMFYSGTTYTPYNIAFIGKTNDGQEMFFYETQMKNSGRLPSFNNWDFRISKTWYYKKAYMNVYLNVVNLFNRQNITGYGWSSWQNPSGKWYVSNYQNSLNIPRFISPGISITF